MKNEGFNAQFLLKDLFGDVDKIEAAQRKKLRESLAFIGEEFINKARTTNTYLDDTGNLRASIGYAVASNGKYTSVKVESGGEAQISSYELLNEIRADGVFSFQGYGLVLFAGMEYAAAVESIGFDVITGSTPSQSQFEKDVKQLLGGINI